MNFVKGIGTEKVAIPLRATPADGKKVNKEPLKTKKIQATFQDKSKVSDLEGGWN